MSIEKAESLSITSVYDKIFEDIYKDLLQRYSNSVNKKIQRIKVPNPNKSELILQLVSKIYEVPINRLKKGSEKKYKSGGNEWLKEARGILYHIHYHHLDWYKKDVWKHFNTDQHKYDNCVEFFLKKKDAVKSTKEKYNYIVGKITTIEI